MNRILFAVLILLFSGSINAQLYINNADFTIQSGAVVIVQGDITSNVDIQGTGLVQLKGTVLQNIDMGGNTIPNLELDNTANASLLNTDTRIGTSFLFTNGKFQLANLNFSIGASANITGANTSRFFWTNGTGLLKKELTADVSAYELPVGENANYRPAYLTTSGNSFSTAYFGVRTLGSTDPNKPPSIASYLKTSWPMAKSGITGGTITLAGQYSDATDITGTEANLVGYFNNGVDWSSTGETHNTVTNQISAPITSNTGSLSGLNKFIAVGARAFLQGAYQSPISTAGLMNDNLRTLPFGPASSTANFPQDDPYRQLPYSTTFTHVNNSTVESIPNSSVVGVQAVTANNIVDWVFLQLRDLTPSSGNVVLQTRSALIQRDGDIVDVDGVGPVTFNNIADGNYIITVRHRNHLGLSFDQSSPKNFTEAQSTAFTTKVADLKTASDAELYGTSTAFTTITLPGPITVKALWAGNSNVSTTAAAGGLKYVTPNSDNATILSQVLSYPGNVSGLFNYGSATGYFSGDNNMNKTVKYTTPNSDGAIILSNILSLSTLFNYGGLLQQIPN